MALRMHEPTTRTLTQTQSIILVKNLLRTAFSSVAFIRGFFERRDFRPKRYGDHTFMQVVGIHDEGPRRYIEWLEKGIFDALHHRYLHVILLEVYTVRAPSSALGGTIEQNGDERAQVKKDKLLEVYAFTVTYGESGAQLMISNMANGKKEEILQKQSIKKNTTDVLRSLLHMTKTLLPLPKRRIISARLLYSKGTPEEYEPPLFQKGDEDFSFDWFLSDTSLHEPVGAVVTPYHQIDLKVFVQDSTDNRKNGVLKPSTEPTGDVINEGEESVFESQGDGSFMNTEGGDGSVGNARHKGEHTDTGVKRNAQQLTQHDATSDESVVVDLQPESTQHSDQKAQGSLKRSILSSRDAHDPSDAAHNKKRLKKNSCVRRPMNQGYSEK